MDWGSLLVVSFRLVAIVSIVGLVGWELSFGSFRLDFAWLFFLVGSFRLGTLVWILHGSGALCWEVSLGGFRLD